jgi:hypothetical protein
MGEIAVKRIKDRPKPAQNKGACRVSAQAPPFAAHSTASMLSRFYRAVTEL